MTDILAPQAGVDLDPLALLISAPGPALIVNWTLICAAAAVWVVAVLKLRQLGRLASQERIFEAEATAATGAAQLAEIARRHRDAPGARVVRSLVESAAEPDLAGARARRALVGEEQRAGRLLGVLSTVGASAPFVGLFGTVWGILDAFLRIGREGSASLPVVAPAIGEALICTAVGLFAAIPAVVLFNVASKRHDDLLAQVEAASGAWVLMFQRAARGGSAAEAAQCADPRGAPWAGR